MDDDVSRIRALANASRLTVMRWLKEPHLHFPTQQHADMQKVGVCCSFISDKLGVAPATTTRHMQILANAGLVRATRLGKYTYYKRIDRELKRLGRDVANF
jgi:ArsR family transcriptional regulator